VPTHDRLSEIDECSAESPPIASHEETFKVQRSIKNGKRSAVIASFWREQSFNIQRSTSNVQRSNKEWESVLEDSEAAKSNINPQTSSFSHLVFSFYVSFGEAA
jgi:hypothetical protein